MGGVVPGGEPGLRPGRSRHSIAKSVAVAGEFNKWNTTANLMTKDDRGRWTAAVPLKPGRHLYKFVVDGNWQSDPKATEKAPDGLGGENSIKIVGE